MGIFSRGKTLNPPPMAYESHATEVLRVWAKPGETQQFALTITWKDPGTWGLMLADLARHAAKAYAREGHDEEEALRRILTLFLAEWERPTDSAKDITDSPSN